MPQVHVGPDVYLGPGAALGDEGHLLLEGGQQEVDVILPLLSQPDVGRHVDLPVDEHAHQAGPGAVLHLDAPPSAGALDVLQGEVELGLLVVVSCIFWTLP